MREVNPTKRINDFNHSQPPKLREAGKLWS